MQKLHLNAEGKIMFMKTNQAPLKGWSSSIKFYFRQYQISHIQVLLCLTFLFAFLLSIQNLSAQTPTPKSSYEGMQLPHANKYYEQENTYTGTQDTKAMEIIADGPIRKLGRGVSNVLFGIFEVFIQPYKVNEAEGGIAAVSYGLFKGLFYFIGREVVGVIDIVTFPITLPEASSSKYGSSSWGYGPLIEPEWIFTIEDNPYNFVYPNYPVD